MNQTELEHEIAKVIFPAFDRLEEDEFFIPYFNQGTQFEIHDDKFVGIDGFKHWMAGNRQTFKPNTLEHRAHSFAFEPLDDGRVEVEFLLDFKAETFSGEYFDSVVREKWLLNLSSHSIKIERYFVEPA